MTAADHEAQAGAFVALTDRLTGQDGLSLLGAGLISALHLGITQDSRSFARIFEIEHSLVLREAILLSETPEFVIVERQDPRTQRLWLRLGERADKLILTSG